MSEHDEKAEPGTDARGGRNTTFSTEAFPDGEASSASRTAPGEDPLAMAGGAAMVDPGIDGFHQPTAMFDKGEFLGELAEIVDGVPETRARVEAGLQTPKGCRLIIVAGPDLGLEWAFKSREIIIGRDEDCQLVMSDIAVSRRHARIGLDGEHFTLTDLGSGNGTFLNGVRIQEEQLSAGDEIIIGERTLRFVELNEAPATSAAQPVQPGLQPPAVNDVPQPGERPRPAGRRSLADVPVLDDRQAASDPAEKAVPRLDAPTAPSGALRKLLVGAGVVAGLTVLALGGWLVYDRYFAGETPAQRALRVKREFLQGIELVKQLRCGDASFLFRRVLLAEPGHQRAPDYLAHCEVQLKHWQHVAAAREMAAARRYIEAIDRLKKVPSESDYAAQVARDRQVYARSIAYALLDEAKDAFEAAEIDKALELVDRGLELAPDLDDAHQLRRRIADASAPPKRRRRKKPGFAVPTRLKRSVSLYRDARVGSAIDAAEAVGGDRGRSWAAQMKTLQRLLRDIKVAHKKKAAGELIRLCPEALAVDNKLSGGEGKVRSQVSKYYADGLYLKGIEALQSSDDVSAFQLLNRAVKAWPEHKLAQTRLAELSRKAREIYYEGYVLKDQDKVETRRIFQRLTEITNPSNPYHRLAADWLRTHR